MEEDEIKEFDAIKDAAIDQTKSECEAVDDDEDDDGMSDSDCFVEDDPGIERKYFADNHNKKEDNYTRQQRTSHSYLDMDDSTDIVERDISAPNAIIEQTARVTIP